VHLDNSKALGRKDESTIDDFPYVNKDTATHGVASSAIALIFHVDIWALQHISFG
jgi:hypothetical protein